MQEFHPKAESPCLRSSNPSLRRKESIENIVAYSEGYCGKTFRYRYLNETKVANLLSLTLIIKNDNLEFQSSERTMGASQMRGWDGFSIATIRAKDIEVQRVTHDRHTICLQLQSPLSLSLGRNGRDSSAVMEPGQILILPANYAISVRAEGDGSTIQVLLETKTFACALAQFGISQSAALRFVYAIDDPLVREIILGLREEAKKEQDANTRYAESMANTLAFHLVRHYTESKQPIGLQNGGLSRPQLRRVLDFIHDNLSGPLSLAALAERANLSVYHFARLFKRSTGVSPHEYVTQRRVERAKEMLLQTPLMNTTQLALQVGFCDQSHLARHFRRIVGLTPGDFVKNLQF